SQTLFTGEGKVMFRKSLCVLLDAVLVSVLTTQPAQAASRAEKQAAFAEKIKAGIAKLGVGTDARVEVRLRDNTKLKGYVSEISGDNFVVTDLKNGKAARVAYPDVRGGKGNNMSTGAVIGAGVALLVLVLTAASLD